MHNVLICHDLLRSYKRTTSPTYMIKIDLRKAYHMVSWEFTEEALHKYSYPETFTKLVMNCMTSIKLSIKVNGENHGYFKGKRGLRKGDPTSPLLLVLVMEYLSIA